MKAFDTTLQQAMLAAMGYLPEALPAGVAGPGPGKRKGAPLSTAAQVLRLSSSFPVTVCRRVKAQHGHTSVGRCCTCRLLKATEALLG